MLAQLWLETAAEGQNVRRVWAGPPGATDSVHCSAEEGVFVKAWRGKTAHHVWAADGGQRWGNPVRHLRPGGSPTFRVEVSGARGARRGTILASRWHNLRSPRIRS